ncbi:MAG: hypothetical protein K8F25_00930, partial [Fimbriimonadaceae bacterium]|nr:hypothetical protein [Alphaproteobacteria bacterium]
MLTLKLACRFWNRLAILAAILMLTGCFTSQSPLIHPENADFPFQSITFVSVSESGENPEEINLTRDGDAYVELTREDEGQYLLVKVDTDLYVAQLTEANDDGELEVLYGVVQV